MTRRFYLIVLLTCLWGAASVGAHAQLIAAEPAVGSTLDFAPAELKLSFDQPIAPHSSVRLLTINFEILKVEHERDNDHPNVLLASLPSLPPGVYTVEYDVLSIDGDLVQGSYEFAIALSTPMQTILNSPWPPAIYFIAFLLVAVGWRTFRVWQLSGVNALVRYRTDGVHGLASNVFRLVFAGIALVLLIHAAFQSARPYLVPITWLESATLQLIGWTLLFVAFVVIVIAQVQMGAAWRIGIDQEQNSQLVTAGIFRYSRNPIFLSMRVCFLGLFFVLPTAATLLLWVLGDVMMQIQVQLEEAYLTETFGEIYLAYSKTVRRWL